MNYSEVDEANNKESLPMPKGSARYVPPKPPRPASSEAISSEILPRWVWNQKTCSWKEWDQAQKLLGVYDEWIREYQQEKAVKRQIRSLPEEAKLARYMYLAPRLHHPEAVAFHAASGLLWRETRGGCEFLMVYESSWTKGKTERCFNLLGGKRNCLSECAEDVMCREVAEETGGHLLLAPGVSSAVIWDFVPKQAIFVRELSFGEQVVVRSFFRLMIADGGNVEVRLTVKVEDIVAAVQGQGVPPEYDRDLYAMVGAPPDSVLTIAWVNVRQLAHVPLKWYVKPVIDLLLGQNKTMSGRNFKTLTKQLRAHAPKLYDKLSCGRNL